MVTFGTGEIVFLILAAITVGMFVGGVLSLLIINEACENCEENNNEIK